MRLFPHTTYQQQTTLDISTQKWNYTYWKHLKAIVEKMEIDHYEQLLLLPKYFQKSSSAGVR